MLKDFGLTTPSVHMDLGTMRTNLKPAMEALSQLGTRYVAVPALNNAEERKTLDQFKNLPMSLTRLVKDGRLWVNICVSQPWLRTLV